LVAIHPQTLNKQKAPVRTRALRKEDKMNDEKIVPTCPESVQPKTYSYRTYSSEMSDNIGNLALALSKAQGEMSPAIKDAANPYFKSKYADLSSVWEAARKPLSKNELAVIQTTNGDSETVTVITTLIHSSGQWVRGTLKMKPVKNDPQGMGSCLTYARRYSLAAIVGVCPDDDDGNAASKVEAKVELISESQQKVIKTLSERLADNHLEAFNAKYPKVEEIKKGDFDTIVAKLNKSLAVAHA